MELLFLLGIIGFVALIIGRGGAPEVAPREHLSGGERPPVAPLSGSQPDLMGLGLDDADMLTNPAYSHLPGNIFYSSMGLGSDDSSDDSDSLTSIGSSDSLASDDGVGMEAFDDDMFKSDNMFLDPEYFWMEGNIYHMDFDDCGMSDSFSSCSNDDDSWNSGSGSGFDDW